MQVCLHAQQEKSSLDWDEGGLVGAVIPQVEIGGFWFGKGPPRGSAEPPSVLGGEVKVLVWCVLVGSAWFGGVWQSKKSKPTVLLVNQ